MATVGEQYCIKRRRYIAGCIFLCYTVKPVRSSNMCQLILYVQVIHNPGQNALQANQLLNSEKMNGKITMQAFQNMLMLDTNVYGAFHKGDLDSTSHIASNATAKK